MAATTSPRDRASGKTASSAKKSSRASRDDPAEPKLRLRYYKRMKPQRVYPLVIEVPGGNKRNRDEDEDTARGSVVVIRPVIAGAQVQPAEQRFEVTPGNQIVFHVTPLARGRLPRARLEVFAPNQPPESIPLKMKAKTQRLAWVLLLLAFLVPTGIIKLTRGDWRPSVSKGIEDHFKDPMKKDLPPVPVFNEKVEFLPDMMKGFTVADMIGDGLVVGYGELETVVEKYRWLPNTIGFGFLVLAFLSWALHRPRRKKAVRTLQSDLSASYDPAETATLQPI